MLLFIYIISVYPLSSTESIQSNPKIKDNEIEGMTINEHQVMMEGRIEIVNCTFSGCISLGTMFTEACGGAILVMQSHITITNCEFNENIAMYAGCLCLYDCNAIINESIFQNSHAIYDIGAVWVMPSYKSSQDGSITIVNSNFLNNQAGRFYGAISINKTKAFIKDCNFIENLANETVGAMGIILNEKDDINLEDIAFINNTSGGLISGMESPALYIESNNDNNDNSITLRGCYFYNNYGLSENSIAVSINGNITLQIREFLCFNGESINWAEINGEPEIINRNYIQSNILFKDQCINMEIFAGTETKSESESESYTETETESESESESKSYTETELHSKIEADSNSELQTENESYSELEFESHSVTEPESEFYSDSKRESEIEIGSEIESQNTIEIESESQLDTKIISEKETETTKEKQEQSQSEAETERQSEKYSDNMASNSIENSQETFLSTFYSQSNDNSNSPSEEQIIEDDFSLNIPALTGGGIGILILIIIVIILIICCCKKKRGGKFGCCSRNNKKVVKKKETLVKDEKMILMIPQVPEHDNEFAEYLNPEYARQQFINECNSKV